MQNTTRTVKWYHKGFALIAIFCSMLMFVAFSGSYSSTMKWVDLRLGKMEMRSSVGMDWLKVAIGSGLKVESFNVQVMVDFPRMAENALISVVSGILSNILGTISDLFGQLISKIKEMSSVFESIGKQSGDIRLAIQSSIWGELEKKNSVCVDVVEVIGEGASAQEKNIICDTATKIGFAESAVATADLTNPTTVLPSSAEISKAKNDLATAVDDVCNKKQEKIPFEEVMGQYNSGCATTLSKKVANKLADTTEQINKAIDILEKRAPADCKQPYVDFVKVENLALSAGNNVSSAGFTSDNALAAADVLYGSTISGFTGQTTSNFSKNITAFGKGIDVKTLTNGECNTLGAETEAALAGTQVTPPSGAGATGLEAVIGKFIESVTKLINDLVDSVIKIALDALSSVYNAFPRIFNEGFSQLFGNFSSVITDQMSGISSVLGTSISDQDYLDNLSKPIRTDGSQGDVNRLR